MSKLRIVLIVLAGSFIVAQGSGFSATVSETFASNPLQRGWVVFGDPNLFQWDATNQNLRVTWDSSQPNSYFYHPLGTILARSDDFSLAFDLQLLDIGPGLDTNKSTSFQIAIGFLNLDQATRTNFLRGTGSDSPDLAEVDYFWDSGFGATFWPTVIDTNSSFNYNGASDYAIFALSPSSWYHIAMNFTASNQLLVTTLSNLQNTAGIRISQLLNTNFTDYRLGALSISSYSDAGQDPQYAGSVLAHGIVDDLVVTVPDPPVQDVAGSLANGVWQARFTGQTNWFYTLERTADFQSWLPVSAAISGSSSLLSLSDNSPVSPAFYRVRASR